MQKNIIKLYPCSSMRLFKNEEEVKYERRQMARVMQHAYILGFRDFQRVIQIPYHNQKGFIFDRWKYFAT